MSGQATATVETLTAEVRVLMVGNRQVTLSVYKQLDHVDYDDMTPFGRVRVPVKESDVAVDLVGVDRESGCLVQSTVRPPNWNVPPMDNTFQHWMLHAMPGADGYRIALHQRFGPHQMTYPNHDDDPQICPATKFVPDAPLLYEERRIWQWLRAEHEFRALRGDFCDVVELRNAWEAQADRQLARLIQLQESFDEASALPLIVLAGLR